MEGTTSRILNCPFEPGDPPIFPKHTASPPKGFIPSHSPYPYTSPPYQYPHRSIITTMGICWCVEIVPFPWTPYLVPRPPVSPSYVRHAGVGSARRRSAEPEPGDRRKSDRSPSPELASRAPSRGPRRTSTRLSPAHAWTVVSRSRLARWTSTIAQGRRRPSTSPGARRERRWIWRSRNATSCAPTATASGPGGADFLAEALQEDHGVVLLLLRLQVRPGGRGLRPLPSRIMRGTSRGPAGRRPSG